MSKKIDLTGKRFGRLVVLEGSLIVNKKKKIKCKCDCGVEKYIREDSLKNGATKSCGCLRTELASNRLYNFSKNRDKYKDIKGNRYGKLTVIKREVKNDDRAMVWLCKCDCGNYLKVRQNSLSKNHTKSCGCLYS